MSKYIRIFLRIALASVLLAVFSHTRADPDLWGHVRFGHDIIQAHTIRLPDRYSFTSDRPWINHEWLAECVMYLTYALGGSTGLIALKILLLAAMLAAMLVVMRATDLPAAKRDLLIGLLVVGTVGQGDHVRPQLFSLVLFACLIASLVAAVRGSRPALAATVPIMAIWANMHGGWLVGAGTLSVWALATLLRQGDRREKVLTVCAAAAAIVATLANPYGWKLWLFLSQTVGLGRAEITEWQPVYRLGTISVLLWLMVALGAAALQVRAYARKSFDVRVASVLAMLAIGSFRVDRLLAFFTIAVVGLGAPQLSTLLRRSESGDRRTGLPSRFAAALSFAVAVSVFAGSVMVASRNVACIRMEPEMFPEPELVSFIANHNVHGRMLTWFTWGEYAIWYFSPAVMVSLDGRRETVYSEATIQRQISLYTNPAGRKLVIDLLKPDYIWLPAHIQLTADLVADGWSPMLSGNRSVLLTASKVGVPVKLMAAQDVMRCFPGP